MDEIGNIYQRDEFTKLKISRAARVHNRRKRDGTCLRCGALPPLETLTLCSACAKYKRDWQWRQLEKKGLVTLPRPQVERNKPRLRPRLRKKEGTLKL